MTFSKVYKYTYFKVSKLQSFLKAFLKAFFTDEFVRRRANIINHPLGEMLMYPRAF